MIEFGSNDNGLMDMDEFTALMHCKRLTVYRWCKNGLIPSVKVGRKLLFRRLDVEMLIQKSMRKESTSEKRLGTCR